MKTTFAVSLLAMGVASLELAVTEIPTQFVYDPEPEQIEFSNQYGTRKTWTNQTA